MTCIIHEWETDLLRNRITENLINKYKPYKINEKEVKNKKIAKIEFNTVIFKNSCQWLRCFVLIWKDFIWWPLV